MKRLLATTRWYLASGVLVIAGLALWPLAALIRLGLAGPASFDDLASGAVLGSGGLMLFVGLLAVILGTATGWLTANCRFPGRAWLRVAQMLPLATPSYLLAATLTDVGSLHGLRIHGFGWAILVLTVSTYPYIFLLSSDCFSRLGQDQLDVCRTLGLRPWASFRRVALPMAIPAIGAGLALCLMEVVNELGAVNLLGVQTLSGGILERWQAEGNPSGAAQLALIALSVVLMLVALERWWRRRSRRWDGGCGRTGSQAWHLEGMRAVVAQGVCGIPPLLSLGIPLWWVALRWESLEGGLDPELLSLTLRSLGLGLVASLLTMVLALVLALGRRWIRNRALSGIGFVASMGYAIPGAVLALGLIQVGSPLGWAPILLLLFGYGDRFIAVGKGSIDSAFERLTPSIDEAGASLGHAWWGMLRRVHLPLLRGPLLVGGLLVFVDTVKELPLTFALRPFDFDTLAVRVYQYAGDERLGTAMIPALMILSLGLIATLVLVIQLERQREAGT